jgi:small nuclear ribonucleoprotein (snRNP)-like protein
MLVSHSIPSFYPSFYHDSIINYCTINYERQPSGKGSKLLRYVEHRLRVTLQDGRVMVGTFLAFDKHLNLVLSETEEFRTLKKSAASASALLEERTEKRTLGLVLIRGENVVSLAVEGPPPAQGGGKLTPGGPGQARGAGRGVPAMNHQGGGGGGGGPPGAPPMGLGAAPMYGVGGGVPPPPPPPGNGAGGYGYPPPGMGRGMPPPGY